MTVVELLGFLSKIPALMICEGTFHLDHFLCPGQALHLYLECVSAFCESQKCLFLNPDPAVIHADHITKGVSSVVSNTSTSAKGVAQPEDEICVHEMHVLASLWRAFSHSCSSADLMAAMLCTFATFCLWDLSTNTFDLCVLKSVVVAQAVSTLQFRVAFWTLLTWCCRQCGLGPLLALFFVVYPLADCGIFYAASLILLCLCWVALYIFWVLATCRGVSALVRSHYLTSYILL